MPVQNLRELGGLYSELPTLERDMLGIQPNLPSAARPFDASTTLDDVRIRNYWEYDFSFPRQMMDVQQAQDPEMILFTANSAIPVADAVRGFYEAARRPVPRLGYINANRVLEARYAQRGEHDRTRRAEIRRLRSFSSGVERVCVVDQYADSHRTVTYAAQLLVAAKKSDITLMRGMWYSDADPAAVDLAAVSSDYSDTMHDLGVKAYELTSLDIVA